jgi:hypothetical protein
MYFQNTEDANIVTKHYKAVESEMRKKNRIYEKALLAGYNPDDPGEPIVFPVWRSSNAMTLSNKIQLVTRFTGTAEEIHTNYDFMHCLCVYSFSTNKLSMPAESLECIINKELRFVNSKYPVCSLLRMNKFLKRGWFINAGQVLKICLAVNELDLKDPMVLKDQLLGVDSAYFRMLFKALENKDNITVEFISMIVEEAFHGEAAPEVFMEPIDAEPEDMLNPDAENMFGPADSVVEPLL